MKCLVVSGPFVPTNEPMTMISYKNLRWLDFEYDVLALQSTVDTTLLKKIQNDPLFNKFHIKYMDTYNNLFFSINNVCLPYALYKVNRYIDKCIEYFNKNNFQFLYTSSFPAYTTRVGYELKKENKDFCWVASFTDPINNSPYKPNSRTNAEYDWIHRIAFKVYCKYYVKNDDEIRAIENADILVFICEEQRDFMISQYINGSPKLTNQEILSKSVIFPLSYVKEWKDIPENTLKVRENSNSMTVLSHFGRVYGLRKIDNFIRAVRLLIDENHDLESHLLIKQYGEFRKSDIQLINSLKLEQYFEINDKIPYEDCLKEMSKSDVLLIFDTILDYDEWQPYLPSKILEYSLLEKDVFALATKKSPTYRIMKQSNAICSQDNVVDIKNGLLKIIRERDSKVNYSYENEDASKELRKKIDQIKQER